MRCPPAFAIKSLRTHRLLASGAAWLWTGVCCVVVVLASLSGVAVASRARQSAAVAKSVRTAGFGDPRPLLAVAPEGEPAGESALIGAVGAPGGAVTLVYRAKGSMYALTPGGRPQEIGTVVETGVAPASAPPPTAVVQGADGSRLVAWYDSYEDEVEAAYAPPGGPFERPQVLASTVGRDVRSIAVADSGDGTIAAVWESFPTGALKPTVTVEATIGSGGGDFETPRALGQAGEVGALEANGAANGAIVAVWPATDEAEVDAASLPHGAAGFSPTITIPVRQPATLALLPDGTALIADGSTVARLDPDGTALPSERVPSGHAGWPALAVAGDGSAALATIGPRGGVWLSTAPPGAVFGAPVRLGGIESESSPFTQQLYAWSGGQALDTVRGSGSIAGLPEPTRVFAAGSLPDSGAVAVGSTALTTPGAQPDSVLMFTMQDDEIYELERPGSFDRRPPRIRAQPSSKCGSSRCAAEIDMAQRVVPVYGAVDKAALLTVQARVRTPSGWHPVAALFVRPARRSTLALPPFERFDVHVSIPGLPARCQTSYRYRIAVTLHARDNRGDTATRRLQFAAVCPLA